MVSKFDVVKEVLPKIFVNSISGEVSWSSYFADFSNKTLFPQRPPCSKLVEFANLEILDGEFADVLNAELKEKLKFLKEGAKLEPVRIGSFNSYSQEVNQGYSSERVGKGYESLNKALKFRVQERLLVPFTIGEVLGMEYAPNRILKFLSDPEKEIKEIYDLANSIDESSSLRNQKAVIGINGAVKEVFDRDLVVFPIQEQNLPLLNAGKLDFEVGSKKVYLKFNNLVVGSVSEMVPGFVCYSPELAILPTDWKYCDNQGASVFVRRA